MGNLISVIVPIYNVEKYIDTCLKSITKQTYKNIEIILVDDGSTDLSAKLCDEWKKKDKRVKVIHQENKGVAQARNIGIDCATGKYISFIDPDDYIDYQMLEKLYDTLEKTNSQISICKFIHVMKNKRIFNKRSYN